MSLPASIHRPVMRRSTSIETVLQTTITIATFVLTFGQRSVSSFCPLSYQMIGPVCGNDGSTYPSMCELEAARLIDDSLDVALLQPCNDYCNEKWDPICGTDMVTYANLCMYEHGVKVNKDLKILHVGQCLTPLYDESKLDSAENDLNPFVIVGK
ncbi:four-domain proteases inhibitor-like [Trichoplusia ni]|uniref:Four-domain proteases inhibitor-like n=1 Tax=Trichoplusia ni TaxID=7111 RepID=A0A7E5WPP4_TRINI|nr:four-domain proteases inhibitor-like [Trichoplusia ni]XP_026742644.1 four-domain proteases inhibitor-like [Trichoplusia ni]